MCAMWLAFIQFEHVVVREFEWRSAGPHQVGAGVRRASGPSTLWRCTVGPASFIHWWQSLVDVARYISAVSSEILLTTNLRFTHLGGMLLQE